MPRSYRGSQFGAVLLNFHTRYHAGSSSPPPHLRAPKTTQGGNLAAEKPQSGTKPIGMGSRAATGGGTPGRSDGATYTDLGLLTGNK